MFHPKISSPLRTPQSKKRVTNSGRSLTGSGRKYIRNVETPPAEPVPVRYSDIYKREKAQSEMGRMMHRSKTMYPIAPDAHIPNSTCRMIFKPKKIKPVEVKTFEIRLDILANLPSRDDDLDDDDEDWAELADPDSLPKSTTIKQSKATLVSRSKNNAPDLLRRLQEESWWKQPKEDRPNLRSILVYLNAILKSKQNDSYESACYYIVEIFRTYGIDSQLVDEILNILLQQFTTGANDRLNICTVRTIAQFMIERKNIIVCLLESAQKYPPNDQFRLEIINAVKFITDVNHSDGINLVLEHMSAVYDASEDNFSLKMIIKALENQRKKAESSDINAGEEGSDNHPLLKKISEERWFPRSTSSITLDSVLDAIISKLLSAGKTLIKTLTTYLVQLHRVIGYNQEQFDRAADGLIALLTHTEADYRLLAASNLANLDQETKAIDLALLNYFLNDPRVLVRTECGETLKKLTGITLDTVLQDCANEIAYLQTLPEENFSLQNYLREKNRLPTPPPRTTEPVSPTSDVEEEEDEEQAHAIVDEPTIIVEQYETKEEIAPRSVSPPVIANQFQLPVQTDSIHFSRVPSVTSTMTPVQPAIRVEINGKSDAPPTRRPRSRLDQSSDLSMRSTKRLPSPARSVLPEQSTEKRSSLVPNNTNMWDSYVKQNEIATSIETGHLPSDDIPTIREEQTQDFIQSIIEEHKRIVGFYRMVPNRRILIPHKISMENTLADQSHILVAQYPPPPPPPVAARPSMNLSDLQHNRQQLNDIEYIQLLSSLVIRSIQVHRQYEKFVPTLNSPSFVSALSVSPAPLHASNNAASPTGKLPTIAPLRPTARQFAHMKSNVQAKAAKEGINVSKAQNMESILSRLLKPKRESMKSTTGSSTISHFSTTKYVDVTHAWFLVQLLRSQGVSNSEHYLQKIIQTYPKFIPILNTRIPQNLLPLIWNDPVTQQLASIFSNRQDQSNVSHSSIKRGDTKPSVVTTDEDSTIDALDYSTLIKHVQSKKRFLPIVRGFKMNPPHHVVKFGFREIDAISPEQTSISLFGESASKSRKRRVYMHLMPPSNDNLTDRQEVMKSQLSHIINNDYSTTAYVPIVSRPPMCH